MKHKQFIHVIRLLMYIVTTTLGGNCSGEESSDRYNKLSCFKNLPWVDILVAIMINVCQLNVRFWSEVSYLITHELSNILQI